MPTSVMDGTMLPPAIAGSSDVTAATSTTTKSRAKRPRDDESDLVILGGIASALGGISLAALCAERRNWRRMLVDYQLRARDSSLSEGERNIYKEAIDHARDEIAAIEAKLELAPEDTS